MKETDHSKMSKKCGWKGFRVPRPSVTLHCSEKPHSLRHLQNLPKDLRPLAELVANPETKESVWLNACIAAGDKSLVAQPSFFGRANASFFAFTGALLAFLALMLNFITATLFSSEVAYLLHNVDANVFMRGLIDSHMTGVIVAIGAGLAFWYSLLIQNRCVRRILVGLSTFAIGGLILLTAVAYLTPVSGFLVTTLAVALTLGLSTIASYCREALPRSFTPADLATSAVGILGIPAALFALVLVSVVSGDYHSSGPYSTPTIDSAIVSAGMLFFAVFGQSFALSLASRTSSRAACTLLSTCVQAPLFLGLCFTVIATILKTFEATALVNSSTERFDLLASDWLLYGWDKAGFTLVAILLALSMAILGSYAGATINAFRSKN
ncbi:MAG: hypothetical protein Q8T09_12905 [Candidatus Melainabacteria bacterium]|nr:hypothetical protein [Candidatus Melainabacteria bacterium]